MLEKKMTTFKRPIITSGAPESSWTPPLPPGSPCYHCDSHYRSPCLEAQEPITLSTGKASIVPSCQVVEIAVPSFAWKAGFGHIHLRIVFPLGHSIYASLWLFPPLSKCLTHHPFSSWLLSKTLFAFYRFLPWYHCYISQRKKKSK